VNLHQALSDIAEIRAQLDRTETHRGFRSFTVGLSVVLVLAASMIEVRWQQTETLSLDRSLVLWVGVAVLAAAAAGIEMLVRARRMESRNRELVWRVHWALIQSILPCLLAGAIITVAFYRYVAGLDAGQVNQATEAQMMLPGIWSMVYGLGLFSCLRHLPRWTVVAATYFLVAGGVALLWVGGMTTLNVGWQMVLLFGVGQSVLAGILYWNLERRDG